MSDLFKRALEGERSDVLPVWFMRQAGRYMKEYRELRQRAGSFFDLCKNVELSVKVTLLPLEKLDVDAAILFSDLLIVLLPQKRMKVDIVEGRGPIIEVDEPLEKLDKIFDVFDPWQELDFISEIIRGIKAETNKPLIGFCGAPFTVLSYIIEGGSSRNFLKTKRFMYEYEDIFANLMDKVTELLVRFARMQVESGVDAFQVFDSWAGALSPYDYVRFVKKYVVRLLESIDVPSIYFSTGTSGYLSTFCDLPCEAVSFDWRVDIADAADVFSRCGKVIQGNLDPAALFMPFDILKENIVNIIKGGLKARAHIFNLGHGILPETDCDKVKWVVETVHSIHIHRL